MASSHVAATVLTAFVSLAAPLAAQEEPVAPSTVDAFKEAFNSAVRARDVEAWARLVAEDVVMMAPSGRVIEGREAFRELWTRSFAGQTGPNPLQLSMIEVRTAGDLAVARVDYGPEGQEPVGQYVWVLGRDIRGVWSLDWWIFNRRPPPQ